jgi:multisubunit Na+/H+ antiporter MnhB subunit
MDKPVEHGHSLIVKTVARVVARLMLLFGMYIVLHGQVTHGGGFAGGVIMALVFILLLLAYGKEVTLKIFSRSSALNVAGSGVLLLIAIAFLGYGRGYFFANFLGPGWPYEFWSAGVIPFLNVAIGLLVVGSLYGIFAALSLFHSDQEPKR